MKGNRNLKSAIKRLDAAEKIQSFMRKRRNKRIHAGSSSSSAIYTSGFSPVPRTVVLGNKFSSFFPERSKTCLRTVMTGYFAGSKMHPNYGNFASLCVNSTYQPYNIGSYTLTDTVATYGFSANLSQGIALTDNPLGSEIFTNLYENYKVTHYELRFSLMPGSSTEPVSLTMVPMGTEQIPSASSSDLNTQVLVAQPRSKTITCGSGTVGGPGHNNTLVVKGNCWDDLGWSKARYMAQDPVPVGTQPANDQQDYVGIYLQILSSLTNGTNAGWTCELYQWVTYSELKIRVI